MHHSHRIQSVFWCLPLFVLKPFPDSIYTVTYTFVLSSIFIDSYRHTSSFKLCTLRVLSGVCLCSPCSLFRISQRYSITWCTAYAMYSPRIFSYSHPRYPLVIVLRWRVFLDPDEKRFVDFSSFCFLPKSKVGLLVYAPICAYICVGRDNTNLWTGYRVRIYMGVVHLHTQPHTHTPAQEQPKSLLPYPLSVQPAFVPVSLPLPPSLPSSCPLPIHSVRLLLLPH